MKKVFITIGLCLLVFLGYTVYSLRTIRWPIEQRMSAKNIPEHLMDRPVGTPVSTATANSPTSPPSPMNSPEVAESPLEQLKKKPHIKTILPRLDDIRRELARDPHVTPQALLQFSLDLSDKMELALKSKEASQYLMSELADCASEQKTASAASAQCIKNSFELSSKYEDLKSDAELVRARATPEAQKIFKGMQNLGL